MKAEGRDEIDHNLPMVVLELENAEVTIAQDRT